MKNVFYLLFICSVCSSCHTPGIDPKTEARINDSLDALISEEKEAENYLECHCIDTPAVTRPGQIFPFTVSRKIVAYQFKGMYNYMPSHFKSSKDSINFYKERENKIMEQMTFPRKDIIDEKTLSSGQAFELEKLLFNRKRECNNGNISLGNDCGYDPHHCIIFYDALNKPVAFIELCFICDSKKLFPKDAFGDFCVDFCDLRKFLKNAGVDPASLQLDHCPGYNFN